MSAGPPAAGSATITERITVRVPPLTAYTAVSDVTRMKEWSPECRGARILPSRPGPHGPAHVGMHFLGYNRARWLPWATWCTVTAAEPGAHFAFRVHLPGIPLSHWTYRFTPVPGGCEITEEWLDCRTKTTGRLLTACSPLITGVTRRHTRNRTTMRTTLTTLRDTLETPTTP